jgi:hypothetical protein
MEGMERDMNDNLIYRQAAIDALDNLEWFHQNANKDMVSGANPEHHQAWYKEQDVYKTLEQLPSVKLFAMLQRACKHRCLSMDRYGGDSELHPTCHHEIYADVSWGECVEGKCPLLNPHKEERKTDEKENI